MKVESNYGERGGLVIIYPFEDKKKYITIQNKPKGTDSFTVAKITCEAFVMNFNEAIIYAQAMLEAIGYARKLDTLYLLVRGG